VRTSGASHQLRRRYRFFEDERELLRKGTFAPFLRASLSPIAIACLRLLTVRPEPLFNDPFLRRRIADATVFEADFPYFAILTPPQRDLQSMHLSGTPLART
jgi:hypothetical protein